MSGICVGHSDVSYDDAIRQIQTQPEDWENSLNKNRRVLELKSDGSWLVWYYRASEDKWSSEGVAKYKVKDNTIYLTMGSMEQEIKYKLDGDILEIYQMGTADGSYEQYKYNVYATRLKRTSIKF